jgi:formiminotetrahydrofolate cyclodeaminase
VKTVSELSASNARQRDREAVREACLRAALEGYEDASLRGLCREGAWEAAIGAIRRLDLGSLAEATPVDRPSTSDSSGEHGLADDTAGLARRFSAPGPPAAGSGAAVCGAIAAGLLEWVARISHRQGPEDFRQRARAIAGRAALLLSELASASQRDAEIVEALIRARSDANSEVRRQATESLLAIGARCSRVATLASEVAAQGHPPPRSDGEAAVRLAWTASACALDLAEANMSLDTSEEWARDIRRRIWRTRLLLHRVSPLLPGEEA